MLKIRSRTHRYATGHWRLNAPLMIKSMASIAVVASLCTVSYRMTSAKIPATLTSMACRAEQRDDFQTLSWSVGRYIQESPHVDKSMQELVIALDRQTDFVAAEQKYAAIDVARSRLLTVLSIDERGDDETSREIRCRLIRRLLQLGGAWSLEAEEQTLKLHANAQDPLAHKFLALSLISQHENHLYVDRLHQPSLEKEGYWTALATSPIAHVLHRAIEYNENDLELIDRYLSLRLHAPELFQDIRLAGGEEETKAKAIADAMPQQLLSRLRSRRQLRSRWILFRHLIASGMRPSDERELGDLVDALVSESMEDSLLPASNPDAPSYAFVDSASHDYWRFKILLLAAEHAEAVAPQRASQIYAELTSRTWDEVPDELIELAYWNAARVWLVGEQAEKAFEVLQRGITRFPRSVRLSEAMATCLLEKEGRSDSADAAVQRWRDNLRLTDDSTTGKVAGQTTSKSEAEHAAYQGSSDWRLHVLDAIFQHDYRQRAGQIKDLETALSDAKQATTSDRIFAARKLAELYIRERMHDQAAICLEKLIFEVGDDVPLLLSIARLWGKAGIPGKALAYWKRVELVDPNQASEVPLELAYEAEVRQRPETQNWHGLRVAIESQRQRVTGVVVSDDSIATDGGNGEPIWKLDLLAALIPARGSSLIDHQRSPQFADNLVNLSRQYPQHVELQQSVARQLLQAGHVEAFAEVFDSLVSLREEMDPETLRLQAACEAMTGDPRLAFNRLLKRWEQANEAGLDDPSNSLLWFALKLGFNHDPQFAYQRLAKLNVSENNAAWMYELGLLARQAGESVETRRSWEQRLESLEGDHGTWWKLLRAVRILDALRLDQGIDHHHDPKFVETRQLLSQILSVRPAWGEAISKRGWLALIEARVTENPTQALALRELAAQELQRGLDSGNDRIEDQYLLWDVLLSLGRDQEAEHQLKRLQRFTVIDRFAPVRILSLAKTGRITESLHLAREGVKANAKDPRRTLAFADAAWWAIHSNDPALSAESLLEEVEATIQNGEHILQQETTSSAESRELQMALADRKAAIRIATRQSDVIRRGLNEINNQRQLDEAARLKIACRYHIALGQWGQVITCLQSIDQDQLSKDDLISLAAAHAKLGNRPEERQTLRQSLARNPSDPRVRNLLADSLCRGTGGQVPWDELESLLLDSQNANARNQLLFAALLLDKGDHAQKQRAVNLLRELVADASFASSDATRVLAKALRHQLESSASPSHQTKLSLQRELRSLYQSLTSIHHPATEDLYDYGDYLLRFGSVSDRHIIRRLEREMRGRPEGIVPSLTLSLRMHSEADAFDPLAFLHEWMQSGPLPDVDRGQLASAVTETMIKLGFGEAAIQYHVDRYEEDAEALEATASAFLAGGDSAAHAKLCTRHYLDQHDKTSVSMLVGNLGRTLQPAESLSSESVAVLQDAASRFRDDRELIHRIADLLALHGEITSATGIYQQLVSQDSGNASLLNNFAMLLAEDPRRLADARETIQQAIAIDGDNIEYLDTKGVILLRAGNDQEALELLRFVCESDESPRRKLHYLAALMTLGRDQEVRAACRLLDLQRLDREALLPLERQMLVQLRRLSPDFQAAGAAEEGIAGGKQESLNAISESADGQRRPFRFGDVVREADKLSTRNGG